MPRQAGQVAHVERLGPHEMHPKHIFATAQTFRRAYVLCRGDGNAVQEGRTNEIIPAIVCLALAIELALKAHLALSVARPYGHKLDELFQELPPSDQDAVITAAGIEETSFRSNLTLAANAFVEWRYIYESARGKSIDELFLNWLWYGLEQEALRKQVALQTA